jgi:hypothetical protein
MRCLYEDSCENYLGVIVGAVCRYAAPWYGECLLRDGFVKKQVNKEDDYAKTENR